MQPRTLRRSGATEYPSFFAPAQQHLVVGVRELLGPGGDAEARLDRFEVRRQRLRREIEPMVIRASARASRRACGNTSSSSPSCAADRASLEHE
jgi:hypothetical protein